MVRERKEGRPLSVSSGKPVRGGKGKKESGHLLAVFYSKETGE